MFAGWLAGLRGQFLVDSVFTRLTGRDARQVIDHLGDASARGWLRFRHAGGVTEIDFTPLLTQQETDLIHGAN